MDVYYISMDVYYISMDVYYISMDVYYISMDEHKYQHSTYGSTLLNIFTNGTPYDTPYLSPDDVIHQRNRHTSIFDTGVLARQYIVSVQIVITINFYHLTPENLVKLHTFHWYPMNP